MQVSRREFAVARPLLERGIGNRRRRELEVSRAVARREQIGGVKKETQKETP